MKPSKEAALIAKHFIKNTGIDIRTVESKGNIKGLAVAIDELIKIKTPKLPRKKKESISPMSAFFQYGKTGEVFYTEKADKDCTAYASKFNVKIKTERIRAIPSTGLTMQNLVKITIL